MTGHRFGVFRPRFFRGGHAGGISGRRTEFTEWVSLPAG
ncbi:hypothetical protein FRUB_05596 [Fimbriiglobus ruber]|uniref:Uncharacterized protein n=1 Tax=Fimbriiglobus ruber TaxID=1908690 RepID=A0A225DQ91_9BACT|nr:hypothetical protein FRUB_05596 [Fimbriiglobus ruber]